MLSSFGDRNPASRLLGSYSSSSIEKLTNAKFSDVEVPDGDTRWADGVRGAAAILVVCSHLTISYAPDLVLTPNPETMLNSFWHWPFVRPFAEGFPWVALFLILSAFVNALKPLEQMRNGQHDAVLKSLSASCFRRSLRIVLPCTIATAISWVICQLGGYKVGKSVDNSWVASTSPEPSSSLWQGIREFTWAVYTTWTSSDNYYDKNQWTMVWFLKGSMALYLVLLGTVRVKTPIRMLIAFGLFAWSWKAREEYLGIPTYSGLLLADFSRLPWIHKFAASRTFAQRIVSWSLLIAGWFLISFPNIHPEWAPWSNFVRQVGERYLPEGSNTFNMVLYIGILMILASFLLSTSLQAVFINPLFLWLGRISFPIYLLHGPLLRSLLNWLLFAFVYPYYRDEKDAKGNVLKQTLAPMPHPPKWKFLAALPIFFAVLLRLSQWWVDHVEPCCANLVKNIEGIVTGKRSFNLRLGAVEEKPIL